MTEIVSILLIGISLSMDTFSLSLSLGALYESRRTIMFIPIVVGIFHFFMPLIGNIVGLQIVELFSVTSNKLLGIILIILGLNIAYHYFKDEKITIDLNVLSILIFAFSVSIDSFSVGMGLKALTSNIIGASIIFSICSASFTYLGLIIGKYSFKFFGKYANILGIVLLLILGIMHLFK